MLGGVINNVGQWDVSIKAVFDVQEGNVFRGRGVPLLHPLLLPICWNSDMMAGPQWVISDHEEKASCWGGWSSKTERAWFLIMLWQCFASLDLPTFGIPLCEYDNHENVPQRLPSTQRVTDQESQLLHFDIHHPTLHQGHASHGVLPTNGSVLCRGMGVLVNHSQWLWWTCLRLHSSLRPFNLAFSPSLPYRSPSSMAAPLFHSDIFPNKTLEYLISVFSVCFPENLK